MAFQTQSLKIQQVSCLCITEDFLKRAIVRTPKEPIPGKWYVDMAIEHYKNGQAEEDESAKSEEVPGFGPGGPG